MIFCIVGAICAGDKNLTARDSDESSVRLLISNSSRVKKDYILTEKELVEHASRRSDFGKIKWTLPELVKKAEKHINEKLMAEISPTTKWPPERYNRGHEYPVGAPHLNLASMTFDRRDDYIYIVMAFYFRGRVGELLELNVVFYLDGEIARIGDHDPKTARITSP